MYSLFSDDVQVRYRSCIFSGRISSFYDICCAKGLKRVVCVPQVCAPVHSPSTSRAGRGQRSQRNWDVTGRRSCDWCTSGNRRVASPTYHTGGSPGRASNNSTCNRQHSSSSNHRTGKDIFPCLCAFLENNVAYIFVLYVLLWVFCQKNKGIPDKLLHFLNVEHDLTLKQKKKSW